MKQTVQRLQEAICICKVGEMPNSVFKECLKNMLIDANDLLN